MTRYAWPRIVCSSIGLVCFTGAAVSVFLAVLPSAWVGHPFMRLAEALHPGIDAPDNWAVASGYAIRVPLALLVIGLVAMAPAILRVRRQNRTSAE
jgi:hypothetical protein